MKIPDEVKYFLFQYAFIVSSIFILTLLGLTFAKKTLREDKISKIEETLNKYNSKIIFFLISIYIVIFLSLSLLRHHNFKTHAYDLGVYTQAIHSTIKGKPLDTPLRGHNFTGDHFIPILFLLVPIYYLMSTPKILLIIQTIFIGLSSLPLYLISKKILKNEVAAITISFSFLLYPPLEFINLFDFHPDALVIASFLFCFYYLLKEKYLLFSFFLLFSFCCKEQMALTGVVFGIYLMLKKRKILWGGSIFFFSLLWVYLSLFIIIPIFNPKGFIYLEQYDYLGKTFYEKIFNLFLNPGLIINYLITPYKIGYLILLFLPVGFISLASPLLLLFALPHLIINLLSNNYKVSSIFFQHNAPIIPFIFLALIYGVYNLKTRILNNLSKNSLFFICIYIFLISIFSHFFFSPSPFSLTFWCKDYKLGRFKSLNFHYRNYFPQDKKHNILLKKILSEIPNNSIISAQGHIVPHIINKGIIYMFPEIKDAEYIILDIKGSIYPYPKKEDFLKEVRKIKKNKGYQIFYKRNDILIFKKRDLNAKG